jgi:phage-related protein
MTGLRLPEYTVPCIFADGDQARAVGRRSARRSPRTAQRARRELGFDLHRVQEGLLPRDGKAMTSIGAGVVEIRVRVGGAFRMIYVAKFAEAVYVLHVFQKKTQRTSKLDIAVTRSRLAVVQRSRKAGE